MRVLCLTSLFPNPSRPGKGIFNWHAMSELARRTSVQVISPVPWTETVRARNTRGHSVAPSRWTEWKGVKVIYPRYLYTPGVLRGLHGRMLELSIGAIFRKTVQEFRPDVVYACWAYPDGWAAARLARRYGLPVAVKVHGSDVLLVKEHAGKLERTTELLQAAACVFTVSQRLRDAALELGAHPETTHVVYEGIDTSLFSRGDRAQSRRHLGLGGGSHRVLFVGNLIPLKGVPRLVDACSRLSLEGMNLELDILGEGPQKEAVQALISARALADRVHLRGWRDQNELVHWYRSADLVVLPSDSEGVPNVLVEAASCGTPFIATAVGGIPEIAHLTPFALVPPGDTDALTAAIRLALNDTTSRDGSAAPHVRSVAQTAEEMLSHFDRQLAAR